MGRVKEVRGTAGSGLLRKKKKKKKRRTRTTAESTVTQINADPFTSTEVTPPLSFSCKYINRAARPGGSNEHRLAGSSNAEAQEEQVENSRGASQRC